MPPLDSNLLGWVEDPLAVDNATLELQKVQGDSVFLANTDLLDYSKDRESFLWLSEKKILGSTRPAHSQKRGTCVGRGTVKAAEYSLLQAVVDEVLISEALEIVWEAIYAGSRVQVGKGRLGNGDGSIGAWAAEYIFRYGLLPRGTYGSYNLTTTREDLAVSWGSPGRGVPAELLKASNVRFGAKLHRCLNVSQIADAVAAGKAVSFCSNVIWSSKRDSEGMCRPASSGGHCEVVHGTWVNSRGDRCFGRNQSWGNSPTGPSLIKTNKGTEVELPQGGYGVYESDLAKALRNNGEAWAIQITQGWKPSDWNIGNEI